MFSLILQTKIGRGDNGEQFHIENRTTISTPLNHESTVLEDDDDIQLRQRQDRGSQCENTRYSLSNSSQRNQSKPRTSNVATQSDIDMRMVNLANGPFGTQGMRTGQNSNM